MRPTDRLAIAQSPARNSFSAFIDQFPRPGRRKAPNHTPARNLEHGPGDNRRPRPRSTVDGDARADLCGKRVERWIATRWRATPNRSEGTTLVPDPYWSETRTRDPPTGALPPVPTRLA